MPVTYVAYSATPTNANPMVLGVPAGTQNNDILVLFCSHYGNGAISTPDGWINLHANQSNYGSYNVSYRVANNEGNISIPNGSTWWTQVTCVAFRGGNPAHPINAFDVTPTTYIAPAVTTTVPGCMILRLMGDMIVNRIHACSAPTEQKWDFSYGSAYSAWNQAGGVWQQTAAGNTGTCPIDVSNASHLWDGYGSSQTYTVAIESIATAKQQVLLI